MKESNALFALWFVISPFFLPDAFPTLSPLEIESMGGGLMRYFFKTHLGLPLCKLDSDWRRAVSTEIPFPPGSRPLLNLFKLSSSLKCHDIYISNTFIKLLNTGQFTASLCHGKAKALTKQTWQSCSLLSALSVSKMAPTLLPAACQTKMTSKLMKTFF